MPDLATAAVPIDLSHALRGVGKVWAASPDRPRIPLPVLQQWDGLIDDWARSDLPLVVRKSSGVRGSTIQHLSGRRIVVADNSPAQWAFMRSWRGLSYSLAQIRDQLDRNEIPFAFATKRAEKNQMAYTRTLSSADNLNKRGWKLCHIDAVGLRSARKLQDLSLESLITHFVRLLSPSNHFLVPLAWAGLGESPEVIDEIRAFELKT